MSEGNDNVTDPGELRATPEAPQVLLTWNPKLLSVEINLQGTGNIDFILMMLEGAKVQLGFQRNLVAAQQMKAKHMEAQEEINRAAEIARNLRRR